MIEYKKVSPTDLVPHLDVCAMLYTTNFREYPWLLDVSIEVAADAIEAALDRPSAACFAAFRDGELVAYAIATSVADAVGDYIYSGPLDRYGVRADKALDNIYTCIDPSARGMGISSTFERMLDDYATDNGYLLRVTEQAVRPDDPNCQSKFYINRGYVEQPDENTMEWTDIGSDVPTKKRLMVLAKPL